MPFLAAPIAAIIGGGFVTQLLVGTALYVGGTLLSQALAPKPSEQKDPGVSLSMRIGGDNPLSFFVGTSATAGHRVYAGTWGTDGETPNAYFVDVLELSNAPLDGLNNIYVDGALATVRWDQPHSQYGYPIDQGRKKNKDHLWVKFYDGRQTEADPYLRAKFGGMYERPYDADMVGRGNGYAIVTVRYNRDLWKNGAPKMLFEVRGLRLYDIRKDSSAGGSGTHRRNDPETWEFSENPYVIAYNVAFMGVYFGNEWLWGLQNLPALRLPTSAWIAAMNEADRTLAAWDNQRQFTIGGEITVEMEPAAVLEEIARSSMGRFIESAGSYKPRCGAPGTSVWSFSEADLLITAPRTITPFPGLEATHNTVEATYTEPGEAWGTKAAPVQSNPDHILADGNRRLAAGLSFPMVSRNEQVQRLSYSYLEDGRRFRELRASFHPITWMLEPGDVIDGTILSEGFDGKQFEILEMSGGRTYEQVITLREIDPADFDPPASARKPWSVEPIELVYPPLQEPTGVDFAPYAFVDGLDRPRRGGAIALYNGGMDDIEYFEVQAKYPHALTPFFHERYAYLEDEEAVQPIASSSFLPGTEVQFCGRYVPYSARDTGWSVWKSVIIPNLLIDAELDVLNDSITSAKIQDAAITASKLMDEAVTNVKLADEAVSTAKIEVGAVTEQILAAQAVTNAKLADLAVSDAKLAANAVTTGKLVDGAITETKISDDAISTPKLRAGAITTGKIAAGAITANEISGGAVTAQKLAVGRATNLIPNSDLQAGLTGYTYAATPHASYTFGLRTDQYGPPPYGSIELRQIDEAAGFIDLRVAKPGSSPVTDMEWSVIPGQRYELSAYLLSHRCYASLWIHWRDVDGQTLSYSSVNNLANQNVAGNYALSRFQRGYVFGVAPANAVKARIFVRKEATLAGGGDSYLWVTRMQFAEADENQIEPSEWSSPGVTMIENGNIVTGAVQANSIAANAVIAEKIQANAVTGVKIQGGTITGNKIAGNTITGDKLVANAITAREMVLTDFSNAIPDWANMDPAAGWAIGDAVSRVGNAGVSFGSRYYLQFTNNLGGTGWYTAAISPVFSVARGEKYQGFIQHWANGGSPHRIWGRIAWLDANQAALTGGEGQVYSTIDSTTRTGFFEANAEMEVPASARYARLYIYINQDDTTAGAIVQVGGAILRRKANAELIVDGAITADKIAANAITAGKISAGAINTSNLMVNGVVVTDKIGQNAVTGIVSSIINTASGVNTSWITAQSASITPTEGKIILLFYATAENQSGSDWSNLDYQLLRNGTLLINSDLRLSPDAGMPVSIAYTDVSAGAGVVTYEIRFRKSDSFYGNGLVRNRTLSLIDCKR